MAINKRERNLLILTITLVVVGVNYILIASLVPKWRTIESQLRLKQRDLANQKKIIAQQPEWRSEYDKLGHNLTKAGNFAKISDVLKGIDDIGTAAGVSIQSKRSLKPEEHDVYREWPVQCSLEASTESLVKFLHGLQSGSGFMTVEQINVIPKPDNTSVLRCEVQIRALAAKEGAPAS